VPAGDPRVLRAPTSDLGSHLSVHQPRRRKGGAAEWARSLDGLLADEGTEYWQFCFGLPVDPAATKQKVGLYQSAYAHIMGRAAYEGMAGALPTADHPFSPIMDAARKVVFSRTLKTAEWANTTIAAGDTKEEIDKLRQDGDGHIVVWGGVSLWRSLMRLDLIDEFQRPRRTEPRAGALKARCLQLGQSAEIDHGTE
jgi:dihydrofolate reductase